jgi:hypothetical protein
MSERKRVERDEPITDDETRGDLSKEGWGDADEKRNPVPPAPLTGDEELPPGDVSPEPKPEQGR